MPHQRRCAPEPSCRLNLQTAQFVIGEPVVLREGALAPAVMLHEGCNRTQLRDAQVYKSGKRRRG